MVLPKQSTPTYAEVAAADTKFKGLNTPNRVTFLSGMSTPARNEFVSSAGQLGNLLDRQKAARRAEVRARKEAAITERKEAAAAARETAKRKAKEVKNAAKRAEEARIAAAVKKAEDKIRAGEAMIAAARLEAIEMMNRIKTGVVNLGDFTPLDITADTSEEDIRKTAVRVNKTIDGVQNLSMRAHIQAGEFCTKSKDAFVARRERDGKPRGGVTLKKYLAKMEMCESLHFFVAISLFC